MKCPPRLALATSGTGPVPSNLEPAVATLGLLAGLGLEGWRVQHYRCRAVIDRADCIDAVTGLPGRHLDAWLMGEAQCRETFLRGSDFSCDLSVIEGTLDGLLDPPEGLLGGGLLGPIAEALQAPIVGVIPCRGLDGFHLPTLASRLDGFILDGLERGSEFDAVRQWIQVTTRRPVLGAIEALPPVRDELIRGLARGELRFAPLDRLGASFRRFADLDAIRKLAQSRPWNSSGPKPPPAVAPRASSSGCNGSCGRSRYRVAYAMDEAFGTYFPDTLDMLESMGADLEPFSPLRDERLPCGTDLVLIGCGEPEIHGEALAANVSLIADLKHHVCRGRQLYAEGGGSAYLARSMVVGSRRIPGAGILPIDAVLRSDPSPPEPVAERLLRESWLGPAGSSVRGYRTNRWRFEPAADPDDCPARSGLLTKSRDLVFRHHAIGSLIHLHPAALPEVKRLLTLAQRPSAIGELARIGPTPPPQRP